MINAALCSQKRCSSKQTQKQFPLLCVVGNECYSKCTYKPNLDLDSFVSRNYAQSAF